MVKVFEVCLEPSASLKGYVSGSNITGTLLVVTDEDKNYRRIEISFVGSGKAEWTEGSGDESETYKAKEEYLHETVTVWGDGQQGESLEGILTAGRHEFPFTFSIPESCPSSYETVRGSSNLDAWVRYVITGRITTKGALKAGHTVEKRVPVIQGLCLPRATFEPVRLQNQGSEGCLCCASGPVALSIELPHSGFTVGQEISFIADLENGSTYNLRIEATLMKKIKLKAHSHVLNKKPCQIVLQARSEPFRARSTAAWNTTLPAIPDGHVTMETPGGMITILYELKFQVGLVLGQKLEVSTAIIIGDATAPNHSDGNGETLPARPKAGRTVDTNQYEPWTT